MKWSRHVAVIAVLIVTLSLTGTALAASTNLYLGDDADPIGTMSNEAAPGASPMLAILSPSSSGAGETNPARFREWQYTLSGLIVSTNDLTLWVSPADPDASESVSLTVHILDCSINCEVLTSKTKSLAGVTKLSKMTFPLQVRQHQFGEGHRLVVKVTVSAGSEGDALIAFASDDYRSRLHLNSLESVTTTTSTTTTSAPASTTTTSAPTTTTTQPVTTTTSASETPNTTEAVSPPAPSTTTTTVQPATSFQPSRLSSDIDRQPLPRQTSQPEEPAATVAPPTPRVELEPIEGLMVGFSSVVEAFKLHWQIALGLGLLMSALLVTGFARFEIAPAKQNPFERIRGAKR